MSAPGAGPDVEGLRRAAPPASAVPEPRSRWRTRVALPVGVLLAFALLLLWAGRDLLVPRTSVTVIPVVAKDRSDAPAGAVVAQAAGWVEPDPFPHHVSALTDGVVAEVLVLEGETVDAGQVVVRLVPDDARLALARAEAVLAEREATAGAAEARLHAAETDWENPVERERRVAVASAAVAREEAEVENLRAKTAAQEARVANLAEELRRAKEEVTEAAVSEFDVVRMGFELTAARAEGAALAAQVRIAEARALAARAEETAAREDLRLRVPERLALDAARAEVAGAAAGVAAARAALDEARLRMQRTEVRAAEGGIVMRRLVAPGDKLMLAMDMPGSAHAVSLYHPEKLQVRVDVPLADAAHVGVGQQVEVVVDVLPDTVFAGVVTRLVHEADIQKNTVQVKVALTEPSPELRPEMLAKARFLGRGGSGERGATTRSVLLPERLLVRGAGGTHVWIADEGTGQVVRRDVTVGRPRGDGWVEARSGLLPGDRLVDADPAGLTEGMRITVSGESRGD